MESTPSQPRRATVVELECVAQQYDWGKVGAASLVYRLLQRARAKRSGSHDDHTTPDTSPYSELWMGTHPSGPSRVRVGDDGDDASAPTLSKYLGEATGTADQQLPFLFKVLSIAKPLSIQAHPDKKLAEELHANQPTIYRDPNHKPELACALTPFEALCGFRPMSEIQLHVREVPELASLLPHDLVQEIELLDESATQDAQGALSRLLHAILSIDNERLQASIASFVARVERCSEAQHTQPLSIEAQRLSARLNHFFEGDVGVFVALLLNHVTLEPGQAIFLGPNVPHAYISGDCIEAMACSDNVVRAGLTPKLKDADTLCRMLSFTANVPRVLTGERMPQSDTDTSSDSGSGQAFLYAPGFDEFSVLRVEVPPASSYSLPRSSSPSIVLVVACDEHCTTATASLADDTREQSLAVFAGQTWFVPAGARIQVANRRATEAVELYACSTGNGYTSGSV